MKLFFILSVLFIVLLLEILEVSSHGRLNDPPGRSTAWRFGFPTPPNYNDNELFCGGLGNQWQVNGGKCGICGDPWQGPRDNECPSGKYCSKVIVKTYKSGDIIEAKVDLTANHYGYFNFRVCPVTNDNEEVTQECLNKYPLEVIQSKGNRNGNRNARNDKYTYIVPKTGSGIFNVKLKLPSGLTCDRCVFQWDYTCGNHWGTCPDNTSGLGCGPQETFRGCADVKIDKVKRRYDKYYFLWFI